MLKSAVGMIAAAFVFVLSASSASAQGVYDNGYYRFATATAYSHFWVQGAGFPCNEPFCTYYGTTDGGAVYTSDYAAMQDTYIFPRAAHRRRGHFVAGYQA